MARFLLSLTLEWVCLAAVLDRRPRIRIHMYYRLLFFYALFVASCTLFYVQILPAKVLL